MIDNYALMAYNTVIEKPGVCWARSHPQLNATGGFSFY